MSMTIDEMKLILEENGFNVTPKQLTTYMGGGGITISLTSGNTWTSIITNSDLNGKINKQKVWNAFALARESDGCVSQSKGNFVWPRIIPTKNTEFAAVIKVECIQDNSLGTYSTKLNANSKIYTAKLNNILFHIFALYGDRIPEKWYPAPQNTADSIDLSHTAVSVVVYNKNFCETNPNIYHRSLGQYKVSTDIYKWTSNNSYPFFQDYPSFRPQFTFKEES